MEKKRNNFLLVCGILMIIGGAIALITNFVALGAAKIAISLAEMAGEEFVAQVAQANLLHVAIIVGLIGSAVELVAGILGCVNASKPSGAGACIVFGILTALCTVASSAISMAAGAEFGALIFGLLLGLVLPVLYLIGAFQNKKLA